MEHVKRQDEREEELRSEVDDLEQRGDSLEEDRDRLEDRIRETQEDFERKKQSPDAPGLQEEHDMTESQGSDVDPRPSTSDNPGAAGDEGQATGNPPQDDAPAADEDDAS